MACGVVDAALCSNGGKDARHLPRHRPSPFTCSMDGTRNCWSSCNHYREHVRHCTEVTLRPGLRVCHGMTFMSEGEPHFTAQAQCLMTLVHLCASMAQDVFFEKNVGKVSPLRTSCISAFSPFSLFWQIEVFIFVPWGWGILWLAWLFVSWGQGIL